MNGGGDFVVFVLLSISLVDSINPSWLLLYLLVREESPECDSVSTIISGADFRRLFLSNVGLSVIPNGKSLSD